MIAPDFRGRGGSDYDPVPARYNPLTYAADVQHLLDSARSARAIFVGTSLGGLVTMAIAAIAPHRIAAAILNDVGPDINQARLDRIQAYIGKDLRFAGWDEAAAGSPRAIPALSSNYTKADWLAMARRHLPRAGGAIGFDYDMAIAEPFIRRRTAPKIDMWPLFAALAHKPLLLIHGALSELLSDATLPPKHEPGRAATAVSRPSPPSATRPISRAAAVAAIDRFLASLAISLASRVVRTLNRALKRYWLAAPI